MEGSQQIRLRWTSHQGTVLSVFDALLSAETLVDVTLCADGQYVRAHKIILSACSPYFQEVLSLDFHKTPIIFLKDVKYSELKALVQYMYRGEVNIAQEELSSLLAVAQSLKIRGLAEVETSGNNMSSDTLIMPELNSSSRASSKAPSSSAGAMMNSTSQHSNMNVQLGLQQVTAHATTHSQHKQSPIHVTNISQPKQTVSHVSISSVPQQAKQTPESRSGTSSSSLPPPTKRLRTHQQTLEPVTVTITPSIPQSHSIPSQLYDSMPAASTYETRPPDQQETHFTDDDVVEQTEPMYPYTADDVKVEVEEGMGHVEHDVGDDEENDNSMSQSSFSDSWKHEEAHGSQSMMGGDGEMPGGSGAGQDLNASAGGDGEGCGREELADYLELQLLSESGIYNPVRRPGPATNGNGNNGQAQQKFKGGRVGWGDNKPRTLYSCSYCNFQTSQQMLTKLHAQTCTKRNPQVFGTMRRLPAAISKLPFSPAAAPPQGRSQSFGLEMMAMAKQIRSRAAAAAKLPQRFGTPPSTNSAHARSAAVAAALQRQRESPVFGKIPVTSTSTMVKQTRTPPAAAAVIPKPPSAPAAPTVHVCPLCPFQAEFEAMREHIRLCQGISLPSIKKKKRAKMLTKPKKKRLYCAICTYSSTKKYSIKSHMRACEGEEDANETLPVSAVSTRVVVAGGSESAGTTPARPGASQAHNSNYQKRQRHAEKKELSCQYCGLYSNYQSHKVKRHQQTCRARPGFNGNGSGVSITGNNEDGPTGPRIYNCTLCGFHTPIRGNMISHMMACKKVKLADGGAQSDPGPVKRPAYSHGKLLTRLFHCPAPGCSYKSYYKANWIRHGRTCEKLREPRNELDDIGMVAEDSESAEI